MRRRRVPPPCAAAACRRVPPPHAAVRRRAPCAAAVRRRQHIARLQSEIGHIHEDETARPRVLWAVSENLTEKGCEMNFKDFKNPELQEKLRNASSPEDLLELA